MEFYTKYTSMKLNTKQREVTADIFGNLAVGWFGAGIIIPVFTKQFSAESAISFSVGLGLSIGFYLFALIVLRK